MNNFFYVIKSKNVDLYLNNNDILTENKFTAKRFSTYREAEDYIKVLSAINDEYYSNLVISIELISND